MSKDKVSMMSQESHQDVDLEALPTTPLSRLKSFLTKDLLVDHQISFLLLHQLHYHVMFHSQLPFHQMNLIHGPRLPMFSDFMTSQFLHQLIQHPLKLDVLLKYMLRLLRVVNSSNQCQFNQIKRKVLKVLVDQLACLE